VSDFQHDVQFSGDAQKSKRKREIEDRAQSFDDKGKPAFFFLSLSPLSLSPLGLIRISNYIVLH
jgi:hypothetical protein